VWSPFHGYAKRLIEVAESDLRAAEVLLESKIYPQAVFLIQQALEKTIKAIALELDLITPRDAKRKLSHYIVERLIDRVVDRARVLYVPLLRMCREGDERSCRVLNEMELAAGFCFAFFWRLTEVAEELGGRKCNIKAPTYGGNPSSNLPEQPKEQDPGELIAGFGRSILTDESEFTQYSSMLSRAMECYASSACGLLKIAEKPEKERFELLRKLAELSASAAFYSNIVSEVYRARAVVSGENLTEDFAYLYALSDMLWHPFLSLYVLYEPFVTYARYPEDRCGPLDIVEGTYVANMAKSLVRDEAFKCVREFIERDVKTERCREILEHAKQRLLSISKE